MCMHVPPSKHAACSRHVTQMRLVQDASDTSPASTNAGSDRSVDDQQPGTSRARLGMKVALVNVSIGAAVLAVAALVGWTLFIRARRQRDSLPTMVTPMESPGAAHGKGRSASWTRHQAASGPGAADFGAAGSVSVNADTFGPTNAWWSGADSRPGTSSAAKQEIGSAGQPGAAGNGVEAGVADGHRADGMPDALSHRLTTLDSTVSSLQ